MKTLFKRMFLLSAFLFILGSCSNQGTNQEPEAPVEEAQTPNESPVAEEENESHDMGGMHHGGTIPENMKEDPDPEYPVGSKVMLKTDHMEGMNGAEAVISGAYETTVYEVSYTPTTGGERVSNHKWVVQEELRDQGEEVKPGDTVILEAEHMEGMKGAEAVVDDAIQGTVYAVDYTPTNGGEKIENHMWVIGDEVESLSEIGTRKYLDVSPTYFFGN